MRFVLILAALAMLTASTNGSGQPPSVLAPARFPSLASAVRISSPLMFCNETVPLQHQEVRERLEKELLLTLADRPQVILWIKRSTRYLPIIEKMLDEHGLPVDLKYIAIIESALRPHVGSPRGAIGYWQFMAETARRYGLTVDDAIDERRNIYTSTAAAIRYFKDLYDDLGSWSLTAAAYNMGEEGLKAEMMIQRESDYYRLYLPLETQRYLFRALAAKIVLTDYRAYGFDLTEKDLYPPLRFDRVTVSCPLRTPLHVVASAADTHFKRIKDFNPHLRGYFLDKGEYVIHVPKGAGNHFQASFRKALQKWSANPDEIRYVVQKGDNLSTISARFNVPLPALLMWNRIDPHRPIHPGDHLFIYRPHPGSQP